MVAAGLPRWSIYMSHELVHITVGYPRTPFMDLLKESSEWNGCRFVGLPQHWGSARFVMFAKETIVKAYLETGDIDMDSVVLFTDAYDILIVEHASTILEKFYATGADLIFAAESNFFPTTPDGRESAKAQFDACESTWRYLNGGGWIGYAWAIPKFRSPGPTTTRARGRPVPPWPTTAPRSCNPATTV